MIRRLIESFTLQVLESDGTSLVEQVITITGYIYGVGDPESMKLFL